MVIKMNSIVLLLSTKQGLQFLKKKSFPKEDDLNEIKQNVKSSFV